ncbi:hypothetical protein [Georgenia sunbinii]|uniref:hypothetical protein n=1 Tax=Georgenia sunbinii TaxID=3117728 RepID=UPI002F26113C
MSDIDRVLDLLPASASRPFVLGIDGRSGAGKSELAAAVVERVPGAQLIHLEDAYRGWDGLRAGLETVADGVLRPLRESRGGSFQRYDWHRGELGETEEIPAAGVVVVEGCGAGSVVLAPYIDALVWLDAPEATRHRRAMDRDSDNWIDQWSSWAAQEDEILAEHDARAAADLLLDTSD